MSADLDQSAALAISGGAGDVGAQRMTDADFARATELVFELSGIVIKEHKREMIYSRLARRLRALGYPDYTSYLDYVASDAGKDEIGELLNAVTTNLTSFFRESHHFDHLRDEILDPMATRGADRVRLWSAACSTGEEPYSIAMSVMSSKLAQHRDLKILATDLDTNVLSKAREGVYPRERIDPAPAEVAQRYAKPVDASTIRISDELRRMITFNRLNLQHEWPVRGPFDAIFCRNVLIYFENDAKKRIVERLARLIRPGGALYLGHSESLLGENALLVSEGRTIYRRLE